MQACLDEAFVAVRARARVQRITYALGVKVEPIPARLVMCPFWPVPKAGPELTQK